MQVCTSLQADNHASTPPLSFLQAGCPSCRPTNSVKALKAQYSLIIIVIKYLQAGEIVESSETQPETPYDRLGPVRPRPTQPPVYLQLVDSSAQAVVEQSGDGPVTSDRDGEKRGAVSASSQTISGEEQPATDIVQ